MNRREAEGHISSRRGNCKLAMALNVWFSKSRDIDVTMSKRRPDYRT